MSRITRLVGAAVLIGSLFAGTACSGGGSKASFCDTLKSWQSQSKALSGADGTPGSKDFTDAMKKAKTAVKQLQASAPSEIKGDVDTLANAVNTFADLNFKDPKALQEASTKIDSTKIEKATTNIEKYAKDNCKIDISS